MTESLAGASPAPDSLHSIDVWSALADGRSMLLAALDGLDEAGAALPVHCDSAGDEDGWRVADVITHVASWDEPDARFFGTPAAHEGGDAGSAPGSEWDEWNAEQIAAGRDGPLAARLERMTKARHEMLGALQSLAPSRFDEPIAAPWGIEDSPRGFPVAQAMHDGAHARTIAVARGIEIASNVTF